MVNILMGYVSLLLWATFRCPMGYVSLPTGGYVLQSRSNKR
jgi:hypothetical protein